MRRVGQWRRQVLGRKQSRPARSRRPGRAWQGRCWKGDALPIVDLGPGRTAKAGASGADHTCAILDDDSVKCWGYGYQLGLGDRNDRGDDPDEMGAALPAIDLGEGRTAKALAAGYSHTCAILDDDSVKCWGTVYYGAIGKYPPAMTGTTTIAVGDDPGEMASLGTVDFGPGRTAKRIFGGGVYHTCVILDNGDVKCWGKNDVGQLGLGDTISRGISPAQMGAALPSPKIE